MPGDIDCLKKLLPGLVEVSGGVIIAGHESGIGVALALSAFVIDEDLWEEAGAVEVEVGREPR